MKDHRLFRSYGKRQWTIGMFDTHAEAATAAQVHVESHGHLYQKGTSIHIECITFLGFVDGDKLSRTLNIQLVKVS